jgi:N-acetylmuramoyl-L-alanine amidase
MAQEKYRWSTVKSGEGLNAFLLRNHLSPKKFTEKFINLNKNRLNKQGQLIAGRKYKIPLRFPIHTNPLFGKKYERIVQKDNQLKGGIYYLVSGHGGPDPGAIGKISGHTVTEDEYAYDIILRLARNLMEHGAKVELIIRDKDDGIRDQKFLLPDTDERCYPDQIIPRKQTPRLHQRAAAINILYKKNRGYKHKRLVAIHLDSRSKKNRTDVFFHYHSKSKKGKEFALNLQNTFRDKYAKHQPNRKYTGTISSRRLYILTTTLPPSAFIELGNINNYRDQLRFLKKENRQALADWICDGIIRDYKAQK